MSLRQAWAWFWPPAVIPRPRVQWRSVKIMPGDWPPTRWWWFATKLYDRNALVTWRSGDWWRGLWMDAKGQLWYEPLLWLGFLYLVEGGWYKDARWTWPWRNSRAGFLWTWARIRAQLYRLRGELRSQIAAPFTTNQEQGDDHEHR